MCTLQYYFTVKRRKSRKHTNLYVVVGYSSSKAHGCFVVRMPFRWIRTSSDPLLIAKHIPACPEPRTHKPEIGHGQFANNLFRAKENLTIGQAKNVQDIRERRSSLTTRSTVARAKERERETRKLHKRDIRVHTDGYTDMYSGTRTRIFTRTQTRARSLTPSLIHSLTLRYRHTHTHTHIRARAYAYSRERYREKLSHCRIVA